MGPKEIMEKWVHYYNTHEVEKLVQLYEENAYNLQVAVGKPVIGHSALRADMTEFFTNIPDSTTKLINLFQDGEWAIIEWTGTGTFMGKKKFTFEGCGFFHIPEGKIRFQRGYWDMHSWLKRLDLPLE